MSKVVDGVGRSKCVKKKKLKLVEVNNQTFIRYFKNFINSVNWNIILINWRV